MTDLSIIIVSYNTKDLLLDCLKSVFASKTKFTCEVIVVDNHSADASIAAVKQKFPRVKILALNKNHGFAVANNRGVAAANGKYVWLLNSDTEVFTDTIDKLLAAAEKHQAWIASCRLLNSDKTNQPQGGALPTIANLATWMLNLDAIPLVSKLVPAYQAKEVSRVYAPVKKGSPKLWVGGTAMLVRRDLYQSMQGMDEHIFMYGEDVEFCLRAVKSGFAISYFPEPKLIHLGQGSGNKEKSILGEYSGLKYIATKHYSVFFGAYLRFMLKLGALLRFIMYTIHGHKEMRHTYAKAFFLV